MYRQCTAQRVALARSVLTQRSLPRARFELPAKAQCSADSRWATGCRPLKRAHVSKPCWSRATLASFRRSYPLSPD